jgi:hypothetical protein
MQTLVAIELSTDPAARAYVKDETVSVRFAQVDGTIQSSVGRNAYRAGDALITGSNGDCWSVSRDRFAARYLAEEGVTFGAAGHYRARPTHVFAKQMAAGFAIARSAGGDVLQGQAQDWLVQYAPGDYGIVDDARFRSVYRVV